MGSFRCSAGHVAVLQFDDHMFKQPCPRCGVDVFKFRDLVYKDAAPAGQAADSADRAASSLAKLRRWKLPILALAGIAVLGLGLFIIKRPANTPAPVAPPPAITASPPVKAKTADVSITNFLAVSSGRDKVKLSLKLTNLGGPDNPYPALLVHWKGTGLPDQLIRNDAYPHPRLPFKVASVRLELKRPPGATGIDVQAVNQ